MSWKYKAGLFLIGAVVVIWVTSAEVTQVRFLFSILIFVYIDLQICLLDLVSVFTELPTQTETISRLITS